MRRIQSHCRPLRTLARAGVLAAILMAAAAASAGQAQAHALALLVRACMHAPAHGGDPGLLPPLPVAMVADPAGAEPAALPQPSASPTPPARAVPAAAARFLAASRPWYRPPRGGAPPQQA